MFVSKPFFLKKYRCSNIISLVLLFFLFHTFTITKSEDQILDHAGRIQRRIEYHSRENTHNNLNSQPIGRSFNIPFLPDLVASPEAAASPACIKCDGRARECLLSRVVNFGLCNLAGLLMPEVVLNANGDPIGDDGGIKVSGRTLCVILMAPRTISCIYDRFQCRNVHSCGILPDFLGSYLPAQYKKYK